MKRFCILFIVLFTLNVASSQPCLPDGITFSSQAEIDNFQTNYPNCTEIEGDVKIHDAGATTITNLIGLRVLTSIGRNLRICFNYALTSLSGLDNLTSIGGYLWIDSNYALTNLTGLDNLTSIGNDLYIYSNNTLTNLSGLDYLTSIGDNLRIENNNALTSLSGLANLISIGGDLVIQYDIALTSLTGQANLTSIGGSLSIKDNATLTSLTGLDNINAGSITNLLIFYNSALSTCEVQSVCDYLASPNGIIEIQDNAVGCNSQAEVEAACGVGYNESNTSENQLYIYPNPSSTQITIETPTSPFKNTFLTIYNINGQQLITHQITEPTTVIDISTLEHGVYIVKATDERTVQVAKLIKQ